jgi:peptidoglycan/LPS O-acetylase OafA/YrhL
MSVGASASANPFAPIGENAILQPRPEGRNQIPALTGLRFVAAFSILVAHSCDWIAQFQDSHSVQNLGFVAMYGMPLFFVLSGFVIHYNYRDLFLNEPIGKAIAEFAAARFARLYPLYFVLLLVSIAADGFVQKVYNEPELARSILAYDLTLTQSWWYVVYNDQSLINWMFPLSWSISTESFFYIIYCVTVFVVVAICRHWGAGRSSITYTFLAMTLLCFAYYRLAGILIVSEQYIPNYIGIGSESSFFRWLFYFSPYVRAFEFMLGCFVAQVFLGLAKRRISATEQLCGSIAVLVALMVLGACTLLYLGVFNLPALNAYANFLALNFLLAPPIGVIIFCVGRYDIWLSRLLAAPLIVALGETSYSIYLVHTWTLRIFERPAPNLTPVWVADTTWRIVCAIAFTLVVSYGTYRLIEVPARLKVRRLLRRGIARVFADRPRRSAVRPVAVAEDTVFIRSRAAYTLAGLMLLPTLAVAGQAVRSEILMARLHRFWVGYRSEIEVVSATYGASCQGYPEPPPIQNLVAPGNATQPVRKVCDGSVECDFEVTLGRLGGDPANGCLKDFSVDYRCLGRASTRSAFIPAEALGRHVTLSCSTADQ